MKLSNSSKEVLEQEEQDGKWKMLDAVDEDDAKSSSEVPDGSSANNDSSTEAYSSRTGGTDDDMQKIKEALTKHETKQVFRLRVIVILILLAAATSVSAAVYHITRSGEVEEFEIEFYSVAEKIIDSLQEVIVKISAVSGLAVIATADAEERGQEWPFVTLNAFRQKANNARIVSGTIYLSVNPIVLSDQLVDWENFVLLSVANSWM
jgi:hypothetical protein